MAGAVVLGVGCPLWRVERGDDLGFFAREEGLQGGLGAAEQRSVVLPAVGWYCVTRGVWAEGTCFFGGRISPLTRDQQENLA